MMNFQETIEWANSRGIGQLHVFGDRPVYCGTPLKHVGKNSYITSYRSFEVAKASATRADNGRVYNDSGELVFKA